MARSVEAEQRRDGPLRPAPQWSCLHDHPAYHLRRMRPGSLSARLDVSHVGDLHFPP